LTRVLVTGVTGFIGGHVARALLARGYAVRALVRPGQHLSFDHRLLTTAEGDIRDMASVRAAARECEAVVHAAALYSFWQPRTETIHEVNVDGTRNVLCAALDAGARRIVYTSTVSTVAFGRRDGALPDEMSLATPGGIAGPYKRTKFEAERIARRMAAQGAPIVIVNPTAPVGAEDVKPTPTGRVIVDFMRGAVPAVVRTGLNFVDVRDVADGHVLALERGTPGSRYLLGNAEGNLTLAEMLGMLSAITGRRAPTLPIPHVIALAAAYIDTFVEGRILRREPRIPVEGTRMAREPMWVDCSKSVRELGMPQRPVPEALRAAMDWFASNGYAGGRRSASRERAA